MRAAAVPALALAFLLGCATRPPSRETVAVARHGEGRARIAYAERAHAAKAALLARINADRAAAGAGPLAYDLVAAKAGDAFCLDAAKTGVMGHWDLAGRAPYDRYADAGGVDWHGENFSGASRGGDPFREDEIVGVLLDAHHRMMAERPPHDGHRRTILDPGWTHVGLGVALEGGEFRMTEEFTRHVVEWVDLPAGPVREGREAPFAARLPKGWNLAGVEVAYEPFPRRMSAKEIRRRAEYAFPAATLRFLPRLGPSFRYPDGSTGELAVSDGVVRAEVPLRSGPGSYWVLVYAGEGDVNGRSLIPATAARIVTPP